MNRVVALTIICTAQGKYMRAEALTRNVDYSFWCEVEYNFVTEPNLNNHPIA